MVLLLQSMCFYVVVASRTMGGSLAEGGAPGSTMVDEGAWVVCGHEGAAEWARERRAQNKKRRVCRWSASNLARLGLTKLGFRHESRCHRRCLTRQSRMMWSSVDSAA